MKPSHFNIASLFYTILLAAHTVSAQTGININSKRELIDVGIASTDITPEIPVRLAGYGARDKVETKAVMHRLYAKAMAIGNNDQKVSLIITVDLLGITDRITRRVKSFLAEKAGVDSAHVVICASHTHGGPEIGNTINILLYREKHYSDSILPLEQLVHIAQYTEALVENLQGVAIAALKNRKPAIVSWGQGQASFAANRRTKGGPVDPALPVLCVREPEGKLKAVFVNYACHGTTLEGINVINGDWISEAQRNIEERHPGSTAMVALGCGADANPQPRGEIEHMKNHGEEIAVNVDKVLASQMIPITKPPVGKIKWVSLPFSKVPTITELIKGSEDTGLRGYYARLAIERIQRGEELPSSVIYPVQVWNFDDKMLMVNLAGEVVVDYSLRLKNEIGADNLWVNGYANDAPCYVASRRVIGEGGYEADYSMVCYDKPAPFKEEVEDIIVNAVHEMLPEKFRKQRDTINRQRLVGFEDGRYLLAAAVAGSEGPNIKYMPEWKAFGWFNTEDFASWKVAVEKSGKYDIYLKWSVSDEEAGKSFVFKAGDRSIKGRIAKTGSWFTYAIQKIGTIRLSEGEQKMEFRSASKTEKGPMLDLAEVILVPAR